MLDRWQAGSVRKCWESNVELLQRVGTDVFVPTLKNFRTEIDGDVKDAIDAISRDRGMTIRAISERVFGWLSTQPAEVQAVILGQIPAEGDFIELVLRRLAAAENADPVNEAAATPRTKGRRRFAHMDDDEAKKK